jgi:hypothetical protein
MLRGSREKVSAPAPFLRLSPCVARPLRPVALDRPAVSPGDSHGRTPNGRGRTPSPKFRFALGTLPPGGSRDRPRDSCRAAPFSTHAASVAGSHSNSTPPLRSATARAVTEARQRVDQRAGRVKKHLATNSKSRHPRPMRYYDPQRHWTRKIEPHLGNDLLTCVLVRDFNKLNLGSGTSPAPRAQPRTRSVPASRPLRP